MMVQFFLFMLLNVPFCKALCLDGDFQFHRLMEETWSQDFREGEDTSLLPRERLGELRKYCNCLEEDQPSNFCRNVFISYHSQPIEIYKHQVKLTDSGYKTKKNTKDTSEALLLDEDIHTNSHIFISEVAKHLLVYYVVVLVEVEDVGSPVWMSRLVKDCLSQNLRLTVHVTRRGGNMTQAILQPGNQPAAIFLLGSHNGLLVKEVSGRYVEGLNNQLAFFFRSLFRPNLFFNQSTTGLLRHHPRRILIPSLRALICQYTATCSPSTAPGDCCPCMTCTDRLLTSQPGGEMYPEYSPAVLQQDPVGSLGSRAGSCSGAPGEVGEEGGPDRG